MTSDSRFTSSVSTWIVQLRLGNSEAAQQLWERYYEQLVQLAQKRLRGAPRRMADEEDVVQSAFATFCHRLEEGRFPQLQNRDDLWRLLVVITARKVITYRRREAALKRGGAVANLRADVSAYDVEAIVGNEPTPEFAVQTADTLRDLLGSLPTQSVRDLALRKMEGFTNEEAAAELGCSLRTVERRLKLIRKLWESHCGY
jgi:RNA polymerase sigma factor (sigma-70 family)